MARTPSKNPAKPRASRKTTPQPQGLLPGVLPQGRVAVVDIGSNSVRLVVFHGRTRTPIQIFNERALCGLGRGLRTTGRLAPDGVEMAFDTLNRFTLLTQAMEVEQVDLLATAAARDAADGADFVNEIKRRFGLDVQVLSGEEEAKLAALGVISDWPHADGLMGDVGGGSLDLVALDEGRYGAHGTLPLGSIYLSEACGDDLSVAKKIIDQNLDDLPWLNSAAGKTYYPVGGSWRALARAMILHTDYPLHIVDNFTLPLDRALDLCKVFTRMGPADLEAFSSVSARRRVALPLSAMLLRRVLKRVKPKQVVFSAHGMREGYYFSRLPEDIKKMDPLIRACMATVQRDARYGGDGHELIDWTAPMFADETVDQQRLRVAASHLADIAWREHPDYRAEQAFHRVLKLPVAGLSHCDRVRLAMIIFHRYNGDVKLSWSSAVQALIGDSEAKHAKQVGLALRLGTTLTGGVPGLLPRTSLEFTGTTLILRVPQDDHVFVSEAVSQRLQAVAKSLKVKGWLVAGGVKAE
ncbi:Ppx/GppA family phosphatase [Magnetospira sp. QH-2]|uniref:Ppx/GppA family phosphatase n=1 Tax=Magnetospira sp. (strain QH-2) TaxID=1288970 RepID=UPI0003E81B5C|nr:Ppx/GppA family phosphatase [Magnetospira sp. QH-2]CCQ72855.1 Putative Ppx/GppA phosphatase [Magnetospira sp. QH-2]